MSSDQSPAFLTGSVPTGSLTTFGQIETRGAFRAFVSDLGKALRPISKAAGGEVEARAITSVPWKTPFNVGPGRYDEQADPLALIPYFACVRVLAEQISALPLQTFREDGELSRKITDPQLIKNPAAVVDKITWIRQMVISLAMRGNAIGLITGLDGYSFATGVEWIHPDQVWCDDRNPLNPVYSLLDPKDGSWHVIPRERVVHIAWFVMPGKVNGLSPVAAFARSIGVGLNAQEYGATWFGNGGVPPATFKNTAKTITDEQAEEITARLLRSLRRGEPLTYGSDWDFNAISINPEEAQFIQTIKANATQMASIFGIPPEWVGGETGGSLTYNSPVQNSLHVYTIVLLPWLTLIEGAISRLIPAAQHVKFNPDGLLRGDTATRYDAHKVAIEAGFMTIDEVREKENLPPLPKPKIKPITPIQVPPAADPKADPAATNPSKQPAPNGSVPARNGAGIPAQMIKMGRNIA